MTDRRSVQQAEQGCPGTGHPTGGRVTGRVTEFDDAKGFGTVCTDDGREFFFHCTQIADGTRTIAVGTEVSFAVVPGHRGQWEAADLVAPPLHSPA